LTHKRDKYGRNCKYQFVPIVPLNVHLPVSPILDDTANNNNNNNNNNVGIATSAIQFIVFAVSIEKIDQSRMAAMDPSGTRCVPQYELAQDQVDDRGRGALAMIDKLTGFNNGSLCELSPSSRDHPLMHSPRRAIRAEQRCLIEAGSYNVIERRGKGGMARHSE
jgi:hypothetical protein